MSEEKNVQAISVKDEEVFSLAASRSGLSMWTDKEKFNQMVRVAQMLSRSSLVPQNYQGKAEDCLIAFEMANRTNMNPIAVMQNLYVVKGKPAWSGQACMALINASGRFKDVRHVYFGKEGGDDRGCYVEAIRVDSGEVVCGVKVSVSMAKSEGWTSNPKWRNMPELMLAYRASAFFARVYCPDMLMGCQTVDEVEDTCGKERAGAVVLTEKLEELIDETKERIE